MRLNDSRRTPASDSCTDCECLRQRCERLERENAELRRALRPTTTEVERQRRFHANNDAWQ